MFINVRNIDTTIDTVLESGGSVIKAKSVVPGLRLTVHIKDFENRVIGLIQNYDNDTDTMDTTVQTKHV